MVVYVVWLPALSFQTPSKLQENGVEAAKIIPDMRARFYSDPKEFTGAAFGKLLNIPNGAPAWDIYFAFDPDARWENELPKPYYWMHQLWGMDPKLLLNGPVFFEHVKKLLR